MKKLKKFCAVLASVGAGILASLSLTAAASEDRWANTITKTDDNNISIDFEEVQVLLPASWSGKCQMIISGDHVTFYQTKSRELWTEELGYANGGRMFTVSFGEYSDISELPDTESDGGVLYIGSVPDGLYYATFPTDVQGYTRDEEAMAEFSEMYGDMDWIRENMSIIGTASDDEYIFPQSSESYLTESDLEDLTADEIQMAINEIYARHHRKFVLKSVQEYFDSKSWYEGTIEPDDFDVNVMNTYEGTNISLMVKIMNQKNAAAE